MLQDLSYTRIEKPTNRLARRSPYPKTLLNAVVLPVLLYACACMIASTMTQGDRTHELKSLTTHARQDNYRRPDPH